MKIFHLLLMMQTTFHFSKAEIYIKGEYETRP